MNVISTEYIMKQVMLFWHVIIMVSIGSSQTGYTEGRATVLTQELDSMGCSAVLPRTLKMKLKELASFMLIPVQDSMRKKYLDLEHMQLTSPHSVLGLFISPHLNHGFVSHTSYTLTSPYPDLTLPHRP